MRTEWPEMWWTCLALVVMGLTAEAIAAAHGQGVTALICAVVLAWTGLRIWRER